MSYPQTSAAQAIRNGQEYWRLFTPLDSSGDIYEAEVSARALVMGPESDISRAEVTYYDAQSANLVNCATISVDKPFIGRLDALASENYQTGDRARLLLSSIDLIPPPGFRPPSAGATDPLSIIPPNIDLLFYLNEEPTFIAPRANRVHLLEQLPALGSLPEWYMAPFYGRRFAEVTVKNLGFLPQPAITVNIYGINFSNILADGALGDNGHQQELLATMALGAPALGAGITDSATIVNRAFDYLAVEIDPGGSVFPDIDSVVTHITVSDKI